MEVKIAVASHSYTQGQRVHEKEPTVGIHDHLAFKASSQNAYRKTYVSRNPLLAPINPVSVYPSSGSPHLAVCRCVQRLALGSLWQIDSKYTPIPRSVPLSYPARCALAHYVRRAGPGPHRSLLSCSQLPPSARDGRSPSTTRQYPQRPGCRRRRL